MRHYRRRWDETRGDEHDDWGASEWFFETADDGWVRRQLEVYETGPRLRYDDSTPTDDHGQRSVESLDPDEWEPFLISVEEFERAWSA